MSQRITNLLLIALLIAVGVYIAQPQIDRWLYSASTPRTVAPRGNLSDLERSTIELFQRVSPSVVQVVGRAAGGESSATEGEGVAAQTGTGYVWDPAGHIVTNNHVVQGTDEIAVRFDSGQVMRAQVVGTAPNYDLAVLRVESTRGLPAPIAIGTSDDLKVGQIGLCHRQPVWPR